MTGVVSAIEKICVIGAGTMGSGIAAQSANAGFEVLLLDVAGGSDNRNAAAEASLERIAKSEPPLLMEPGNIGRITPGNIEDDLARTGDCDWVVEAIVERLDVKKRLYNDLAAHLKDGAVLSSNTSTIPISLLTEDMDAQLRSRFCITHFFNPVRYMRLLELVRGTETDPAVMTLLGDFCDRHLGKGVVECADTPGFLGNRVGVFALQAAIHEATVLGFAIEEADAVFGRPMGIPKTGAFGLYDLIGLDLMADVVRSLRSILPQGDPFHEVGGENALINSQVERGFTGNKGNGGFYATVDGERMALDLASGEWRARKSIGAEEGADLATLISGNGRQSLFAWNVLARVLTYAASLVPEVTHSPQDIDDAMKLGYNWIEGPFEMIDRIGSGAFVARLEAEGRHVPQFLREAAGEPFYRADDGQLLVRHWGGDYQPVKLPEGVVRFHMLRRTLDPVAENASASLFHLDGGVRLVEFHTKANALDGPAMEIVARAAADPGPGILVHNDAAQFSAGVNLVRFLELIEARDWNGIDEFLQGFQNAVRDLLYCDASVVGAPSGLALGGGYEVLAHCDMVVAHTNSVMGLVEALVGLVPGGGGVKETYWRWYQRTGDWRMAAWNTFNQIGYGQTGTSPALSAKLAYFEPERDRQVMNRDRLIEAGLEAISDLREGYAPRTPPRFELAGRVVFEEMLGFLEKGRAEGKFLNHDVRVATAVGEIVTGGEEGASSCSEADMFARERAAFIGLAQTPQTLERIKHLLAKGRPLRN